MLVASLTAVLGLTGLAISSQMAIRATLSLTPGDDIWISLPYRYTGAVAQDVCDDIGPRATLVSRFDSNTALRKDWTCPFGDNFALIPGEGIWVRVSDDLTDAPVSWVVSGSHWPGLPIPMGGFTQPGVDYIISLPFHTTSTLAQDVCDAVGPTATLVSRFDTASGNRIDWTCPFGDNFPIGVGEAFAVRVSAPTPPFVPAHY